MPLHISNNLFYPVCAITPILQPQFQPFPFFSVKELAITKNSNAMLGNSNIWPSRKCGIILPVSVSVMPQGLSELNLYRSILGTNGNHIFMALLRSKRISGFFFFCTFYNGIIRACVHACSVIQSYSTLWDPLDCSLPGSVNFSGKNTRVDCHFLLQGIFPTQGSKPNLPCLLLFLPSPLNHQGSP